MTARLFLSAVLVALISSVGANALSQKDAEWKQLETKNFNVIGNASEKEIIRVARRLELFRQAFRQMFPQFSVESPVQTNVLVFKNYISFRPFKPRRPDGRPDEHIAGYFQSGNDVNYVVLSVGRTEAETFRTVFHEYVHFLVNANIRGSAIPAWLNEGLAEYYQSFSMSGERRAQVGTPNRMALDMLRKDRMMASTDFFGSTNNELRALGNHSRSIFYAQAWATMHYLMTRKKRDQMEKFIELSMKGRSGERAFVEAFGLGYEDVDSEIRAHLAFGDLRGITVELAPISTNEDRPNIRRLKSSEVNAYLGDLFYRTGRDADAEKLLQAAIAEDPSLVIANTSLGMLLMSQKRLSEARRYLERAVEYGSENFVALYQLAFLISQESKGDLGFVTSFPKGEADRMRALLRRSIRLNPDFAENYELLAFVSLVSDEGFEEAVEGIQRAISLRPEDQRYAVRLAELYLRQDRFEEATNIVSNAEMESEDERLKGQARIILDRIKAKAAIYERSRSTGSEYQRLDKRSADPGFGRAARSRISHDRGENSPEEIAIKVREMYFRAISRHLRRPVDEEFRFVGRLERIECRSGRIEYHAIFGHQPLLLTSRDFQGVYLTSYVAEAGIAELGCGVRPVATRAVITYLPDSNERSRFNGTLISVEFVPADFNVIEN